MPRTTRRFAAAWYGNFFMTRPVFFTSIRSLENAGEFKQPSEEVRYQEFLDLTSRPCGRVCENEIIFHPHRDGPTRAFARLPGIVQDIIFTSLNKNIIPISGNNICKEAKCKYCLLVSTLTAIITGPYPCPIPSSCQ